MSNNIRVLIIEDDPGICEIQTRFVERVPGFEVIGLANTIADADEMLAILSPQLVLLDIYFPDGNGIDLLWKIRKDYHDTDIILITAAKEIEPLQEALRGGVFDYILKPVVFSRFESTLNRYFAYKKRLSTLTKLDQKDVDAFLNSSSESTKEATANTPKGIDPLTLTKIKDMLTDLDSNGISADQLGKNLGVSRTTARRYLEYMVSLDLVEPRLDYGTVGRPERRYYRCNSI